MGQRMFVAVRPSEGAVEDLEHFLEPRQDAADFPFVRSSQWHLTLSFMASVSDHALGPLEERLAGFERVALGRMTENLLGLSLAKRTIESHGGQMWYERGSDGGSSFVIEAGAA